MPTQAVLVRIFYELAFSDREDRGEGFKRHESLQNKDKRNSGPENLSVGFNVGAGSFCCLLWYLPSPAG